MALCHLVVLNIQRKLAIKPLELVFLSVKAVSSMLFVSSTLVFKIKSFPFQRYWRVFTDAGDCKSLFFNGQGWFEGGV